MFVKLWERLKANPVTTLLGILGGAAVALSVDPAITGHPADAKTWLTRIGAALMAALGAFSSDAKS